MNATPVTVRMPPEQLERLDRWIARLPEYVSRPEALRRLAERGLAAESEQGAKEA